MDDSLNQAREMPGTTMLVLEPRRALAATKGWVWARRAELICAVLLTAAALQMLGVIKRKNITIDEIVMIPSSYYHLVTGNLQYVSEHPPLSKFLAAIPLLFIQPNEVPAHEAAPESQADDQKWAADMRFWMSNNARFETISFWTRVPMIVLTIGLGVVIFVIAREMFDPRAAVFAVALFSLEPTVLAHGRVVQTDIPAAFGYLIFFAALYRYLRQPTMRRALWLGAATAVAILAKFSMLLTGPILVVILIALLWRAPRKQQDRLMFLKHAAIVTLVVLAIVNAAYFFQSRPINDADVYWMKQSFPVHHLAVERTVRAGSYILPTDFVLGIFFQVAHNAEGHPASILGKYSDTGWWYYFPVAFGLKTTIPFLLVSLVSLGWAVYRVIRKHDLRLIELLAPFAIYTAFVMFSQINIGVRYYLPAFSFLFILAGAFLSSLLEMKRARIATVAIVCLLFCWTAFETARTFPNYLSYMNQLAANHPRWWYLSDSNLEWGDNAKGLAAYLHARGETRIRTAFLGDFFLLRPYGVEAVNLFTSAESEPEKTRYVAIGAGSLNGSTIPGWPGDPQIVAILDEFRRRRPEVVIGNSIYVYRVHD